MIEAGGCGLDSKTKGVPGIDSCCVGSDFRGGSANIASNIKAGYISNWAESVISRKLANVGPVRSSDTIVDKCWKYVVARGDRGQGGKEEALHNKRLSLGRLEINLAAP